MTFVTVHNNREMACILVRGSIPEGVGLRTGERQAETSSGNRRVLMPISFR